MAGTLKLAVSGSLHKRRSKSAGESLLLRRLHLSLASSKDGKIVKGLLELYGQERLELLLDQIFTSSKPWIKQSGYTLGAFKAVLPQLLMADHSLPRTGASVETGTGVETRCKRPGRAAQWRLTQGRRWS